MFVFSFTFPAGVLGSSADDAPLLLCPGFDFFGPGSI